MKSILQTESFPLFKEIFEKQLDLLINFTRCLAYFRAIRQDYTEIKSNKVFWGNISDVCYLRAINDWCIVFGADHNESHWKKLPQDDIEKFTKEIRDIICSASSFSESNWSEYHKEIVDFRNGYVAHKNIEFSANVPDLTKALDIATAYFEKLKEILRPSSNEPEPLNVMFPKFQIEILLALSRPTFHTLFFDRQRIFTPPFFKEM